MIKTLSPKQVARAMGVSESSLKRWCDRGLIQATKTSGGHRRLVVDSVLRFLRESGTSLAHPELLELPARSGRGRRTAERSASDLYAAFLAGDEIRCRQILLDMHAAGVEISRIGDEIVAPAMRRLGEAWTCGKAHIFQERRAVEMCSRAFHDIRQTLAAPSSAAPSAIGGTPANDPYSLSSGLVELVLRQHGWAAQLLGSELPLATLMQAIRDLKPSLFWLSVSHLADERQFVAEYREFYQVAKTLVPVVIGGRGLTDSIRSQIQYSAFCDNLRHLEGFLAASGAPPTSAAATGKQKSTRAAGPKLRGKVA